MLNKNRIISGLVCFTVSWTQAFPVYAQTPATVEEIHEKYPNAHVIQVTREAYPALAFRLAQSGYQPAGESGLHSRDKRDVYNHSESDCQPAMESDLPSEDDEVLRGDSESAYPPAGDSAVTNEEGTTGALNGQKQIVDEGGLTSEGDGQSYGDAESAYLSVGETGFPSEEDKVATGCSDSEYQSAGERDLSGKDEEGSPGDTGGSDESDSRRSDGSEEKVAAGCSDSEIQSAGESDLSSNAEGGSPSDSEGSDENDSRRSDDNEEADSDSGRSNSSVGVSGDFLSDFNLGGNNAPAVVFVVIGAIVLVVWTLYAIKYLFEVARDTRRISWTDFVTASSLGTGDEGESLRFIGVKLLTGIESDGDIGIGLSGEIGESMISLPGNSLDLRGKYWLLGPMFRLNLSGVGKNPHYLQMEFVAGSTENSEIGIIAQAKAGLNFGLGEHLRWGLSFGALNINLSETEGIIQERSQFHSLMGIELGYRF